ncbi:PREDICTED: probable eukaryotic translation initiation factor 5-1 [Nicotiana attenuata]|uniref:Eukaryotic translation initiation factor 5-2 n=1 Tax=Nicotiana attenuata TaxID=49451 RepID=A0A1J6KDC2_NICAT|nr:PREDICTED: probable eukaryotic translation initiation factor 5-1 [Nicotiana attenuata]XP_019233423.1 PREDICTED: probable eukaryotic translation initiation factor 5-1 [Nicotiana attenuata]OIT27390.1 putative eukaryotic translation initiation factor 5-2 [Nicotiana attenuata]
MALQNIGAGNKDDAFYRYKMPRMITKIEGRGNGIKTNVVNMVDIAKALGRPPSYTTKYFGCELGAQSKFDEKTGTSHVNGAHDTAKLAGLLENFIKKYVQCYGCGNPETEILITKSQMLTLKCAACGFISDVDMRDKLTTFILKNPPEQKKGSKDKKAMRRAEKERLKEGEAADEEAKKLKKEVAKKKGSSKEGLSKISKKKANVSDEEHSPTGSQADQTEAPPADSDDDVEWQTDTSMAAAQQRIQEQLNAVTASMVMLSATEEKSDKSSPAREEKPKANGQGTGVNFSNSKESLVAQTNGVKHGNSKEKLVDAKERVADEIKEHLNKGLSVAQLKSFLGSISGSHQDIVDALFEALFGGVGKGFSKEVTKKKKYLAAVLQEDGSQLALLHAIESFCGKSSSEAVKEVALVLKALYDVDMLEEEFIVEWYEKGSKGSNKLSPIWKNVKPFVEWLQSAESETEDE